MKKPILVVMAAGMGSRYGGLKQIDPVGKNGEIIMDFSVFDALNAGFSKVIFIIKEEMLADFRSVVGDRIAQRVPVEYAFQKLDDLPEGFTVPQNRVKPWGTGHAVLAARDQIDAPFTVINADDFYGRESFVKMAEFLSQEHTGDKAQYAMVGYQLKNTINAYGHVARGICVVKDGVLENIVERTRIERRPDGPAFTEDNGEHWTPLDADSTVSMNFWGFTEDFVEDLKKGFVRFLQEDMPKNPEKAEFFLPFAVNDKIVAGEAQVRVLQSADKWYGVTYKEDKPMVVQKLAEMVENGVYPDPLWK